MDENEIDEELDYEKLYMDKFSRKVSHNCEIKKRMGLWRTHYIHFFLIIHKKF